MNRFFSFLFVVCLSLVSCQDDIYTKKKFVQEIELTSSQYMLDQVQFRYPYRIRMYGNKLFIMDLHGDENYIYTFSYPDLHYLRTYGKKGSGPNEILDCKNIRIDENGHLWMLDSNKNILVCFSDTEQYEIPLPRSLIRTLDFDLIGNSQFVVPDYKGESRCKVINKSGEIVEEYGEIPSLKYQNSRTDIALAQAWRSFLDYNPENGILAIATQLGEVIEIYDALHDSLIATICGPDGEPKYLRNNGFAKPNGIMGYSDVQVGSKAIYALFWGQTLKDIQHGKVTHEGGNRLEVFDLHGNLTKVYLLDRYITGFQIDEKTQTILALDPNCNQPLVEYCNLKSQ